MMGVDPAKALKEFKPAKGSFVGIDSSVSVSARG
jgi:hypothetical protein